MSDLLETKDRSPAQWERVRRRLPDAGVITAIEVQRKDPNQRRLRVDGRVAVRLTADEVEQLELAEYMTWDEVLADRVAEQILFRRARKTALNLLSRRAFSIHAMRERLLRRGFPPSTAQSVVDGLVNDGWLDDERLARDLVESMYRDKPAGTALIVEKLRQRGIDDGLARRIAEHTRESQSEYDAAMQLAETRFAKMSQTLDDAAKARRLAGALARRGFEQETVEDVVRRVVGHDE